jgi:lipoxygenase
MLKPQLTQQSQYSTQTPFLQHFNPFIHGHGNGNASLPIPRQSFHKKNKSVRVGFIPGNIKAVASSTEKGTSVKAIVTVKPTVGGFLSNLGITRGLDDIRDLLGQTLQLELVSTELDPSKYPFKKIIPQQFNYIYIHQKKRKKNRLISGFFLHFDV